MPYDRVVSNWPRYNGREIKIRRDLPTHVKMQIYDNLFRKMQKMIDKYNPCKKEVMPNLVMRCRIYEDISQCCANKKCKYLTPNGCGTENIACKLHLCFGARWPFIKDYPKIAKRWGLWQFMAMQLDMYHPWLSRTELHAHLRKSESEKFKIPITRHNLA
jgi:hypothetical protein